MTTAPDNLPPARELGLVPGLAPEELRRIYRALARRYHPDSGLSGSEAIMRHINALYDDLKNEPANRVTRPPETAPAAQPRPASPSRPKPRPADRAKTSLGELFFTEQARVMMSEALIEAVDGWLERSHGVPRNGLRRRLLLGLGRIAPVSCPGLHMPQRVSMTRTALRFHFITTPAPGLNLIALPVLSNHGLRLVPSGMVPVFEEMLTPARGSVDLPADLLRKRGFALTLHGQALPVTLVFAPAGAEGSSGFYRLPESRYRGLLFPAPPLPDGFRSPA